MKSSSELFPVSLIRAEVVAEKFIEDTYLVKPNNSDDRTIQIAVTRLGYYNSTASESRQPVLMVHGSFTNRGFWFSQKGKGLARQLLEAGLDPWMIELRGHGDSPENTQYQSNSIESYAEYDLPAIAEFITEQTGKNPFWLGHSMGGVTIATSIATGKINNDNCEGIVLLGSQVSRFPLSLRVPFLRVSARLMLAIKKPLIKSAKGPEHEPLGIAREFVRWGGLFHGWKSSKGLKYWNELKDSGLPVLAFGAKKDKGDPAKHCKKLALSINPKASFYELSKQAGYSMDYGHVNMVISEQAKSEVWPQIINWINNTKGKQKND